MVDDEVNCLCAPTVDAEGLVFLQEEDEVIQSFVEVGTLKEMVNLLKESDSEKCAGSQYEGPDLFYEATVGVHCEAKLRKYLGFDRRDKNTRLDVVAEDVWANDGLWVFAAEIELWYFLSRNEASDDDAQVGGDEGFGFGVDQRFYKGHVFSGILVRCAFQESVAEEVFQRFDCGVVSISHRDFMR